MYDITPRPAVAHHATTLAASATFEQRAGHCISRIKRIAVGSVLLGVALSLSVAAAHAQEKSPTVNVNTATTEELQYLPGIGPKTADNLLYAREQGFEFESCQDLTAVSGIGEKTAEKICPFVSFEGPTTAKGPLGSSSKSTTTKFKRPTESR